MTATVYQGLSAGDEVDRYRVVGWIGSGAMGEVWEVEHVVLGTRRALKVLTSGSAARLVREGQLQARVDHDHVLPVLDVLLRPDLAALVLPLVDGPTLAALAAQHRLSPAEVRTLGLDLVEGLSFAHERGVVHRDLKPANVLLDRSGPRIQARIADFGLAMTHGEGGPGRAAGTIGYAAPEQLDGQEAGPAADWWALGVVLYELLMGHRPALGAGGDGAAAWVAQPDPAWRPLLSGLLTADHRDRWSDGTRVRQALLGIQVAGPDDPLEAGSPLAAAVENVLRTGGGSEGTLATFATADEADSPTHTEPHQSHNLPAERDPLVGRQDLLRAVSQALTQGSRVVSVIGPGGVGKTRLSLDVARGQVGHWVGGVWAVDARSARSVDDLATLIARPLGLALPDAPLQGLAKALSGRGATLVVLDNAELALDVVRDGVDALLDAVPETAFLITSREPVRVNGEALWPLDVLALPDTDPGLDPLEAARRSPAVQLFERRARAAKPSFQVDRDNAAAVSELVRLLDGLPLALELAAARVRIASPERLLSRMSRRFDLLVERPGADGIARTLRNSLDASWGALGPWERRALSRMSVFEAPARLDALEAVLQLDDQAPLMDDVLADLVDKSLVRVVGGGEEPRFELLMSVRDYARERLGLGEERDALVLRHGLHLARWGRRPIKDVVGVHGGRERWLRLADELPDLLAASQAAVERGDRDVATATALAAFAVLEATGPLASAVQLLQRARGLWPDHLEITRCLGLAHLRLGDMDAASGCFDAAHAIGLATADTRGLAEVLNLRGLLLSRQGRVSEAETAFHQARELSRQVGNRRIEGVITANLVLAYARQGSGEQALRASEEALVLHRAAGDERSLGRSEGNLGVLLHERGRLSEALSHYSNALKCLRGYGDLGDEALFLGQRGLLQSELGHLDAADRDYRRALRLCHRLGDRWLEGSITGNRGLLASLRGDWSQAGHLQARALALHQEVGDPRSAMIDRANLGQVRLHSGDPSGAASLLDEALEQAGQLGDVRAQGAFLGMRAQVWLAVADPVRAAEALDRGEGILHEFGDQVEWAKLRCTRVELARAVGDELLEHVALADALAVATQVGCTPMSSLGRALARVE